MSSNWDPLIPDWGPLTPKKTVFTITYAVILFSTWICIPYFGVSQMIGEPAPQWFVAILVAVSIFEWSPFCRWIGTLCGPWRRFHAWAFEEGTK